MVNSLEILCGMFMIRYYIGWGDVLLINNKRDWIVIK